MRTNKITVEERFIVELTAHPTFQHQIAKIVKKGPKSYPAQPLIIDEMVQQITNILSDSYQTAIDKQSLNVLETCEQMTKEIELLRLRVEACQAAKTDVSFLEREQDQSLFSEVSVVESQLRVPFVNPENKGKQSSFITSLLLENNGKDIREELQQKLKQNYEEFGKIQVKMMERVRAVEMGVNRKTQNIFKTLSSLFESINDLQLKYQNIQTMALGLNSKGQTQQSRPPNERGRVCSMVQSKTVTKEGCVGQSDRKDSNRRRSFLGFNY